MQAGGKIKITVQDVNQLSVKIAIDKPNHVVVAAPPGQAPHLSKAVRPYRKKPKEKEDGWTHDQVVRYAAKEREVETFAAIKNKSDQPKPSIRFKKSRKIQT